MSGRNVVAERWLYTGLVATTTALAAERLWSILRIDGMTPLKVSLLALFVALFGWIAASFWLAALGACLRWMRMSSQQPHDVASEWALRPRSTAIVVPICNEDTVDLFARIDAMHEALGGCGNVFDFYVLSDSTDPSAWIAEELEWDRLRRARKSGARVFYRHRPQNAGRKSGNIHDFCENWGSLYSYMVILDADSLMSAETLLELVRRMDANPGVALIQVPPALIGRQSLFARMQQFASSLYGPLYWEGMARLQASDGNYWGHNAILRVCAFTQNCGLPRLPGRAPLGGEILSHDFVEAALLRRAGWGVLMAPDLGGSYEESPPSLVEHLRRDRRWCEGNLQHIKLIFARGFRTPSRLHMAVGVMGYLSSPIWLVMLLVSVVEMYQDSGYTQVRFIGRYPVLGAPNAHPFEFAMLAVFAAVLLYAPKLFALIVLGRDRDGLRAHGGMGKAVQSVLWESCFSTLIAPVVMLSHAWFVLQILLGRSALWSTQRRREGGVGISSVARAFAPHTTVGLGAGALAWHFIPESLPWLTPLLLGLALAIPLVIVTASAACGRTAARAGLFLVPSETTGLAIQTRFRALAEERRAKRFYAKFPNLPQLAVADPFVNALHLALLRDVVAPENIASAEADAPDRMPASKDDWRALLSDPARLKHASALQPAG